MGKTNAVVVDYEAINLSASEIGSIIHTISLIPVTLNTGKMEQFTIHCERGLIIKIKEILNDKEINEILQTKKEMSHVNNKHIHDMKTCHDNGIPNIRTMKFYDAIKLHNKFIASNGGVLIGHNLINKLTSCDFKSLVDTQKRVKGRRILKNNLASFPMNGMYDKQWKDIKIVDTMSLFFNRCSKMITEYKAWWTVPFDKKLKVHSLQSLTRFVKNDPSYNESHSAVQDTIDLFMVLKYAYKCDGPILDKYSYFAQPNWITDFRVPLKGSDLKW